jgi:glycosyltransferase involved in cell wall biosynthesis
MNPDRNGNQEKTVVLVNRAMYLPGEGGYKRTMYLYDMMRNLGHKPILLTSDFNHYKKAARDIEQFKEKFPDYNDIVFLHTRTYSKNISIKRRMAENDWKNGVVAWVKENAEKIDVVMMSMPDMNTILAVSKVCKEHNIEIVIDVRDLRPEAFKVLLRNEVLYSVATYPMKVKADKAYACADKLFAVSEEYLQRGSVKKSHAKIKKAVYIGAVIDKFDEGVKKFQSEIIKPENEIWLTYAGTLGTSYDLITVIDAVNKLKDKDYDGKRIKFVVLGQGPDRTAFEAHAKEIGATNIEFIGFVDYEKMAAFLSKSEITINAIKSRGSQSIINKVADYFAAGIPMLNGCVCKEQQDMVDEYNVGLNYEPENVASLITMLDRLAGDGALRSSMGKNARKLAEAKFDRNHTYKELITLIYE